MMGRLVIENTQVVSTNQLLGILENVCDWLSLVGQTQLHDDVNWFAIG